MFSMSQELKCLSCEALVSARPFVDAEGVERITGKCTCGLIMSAIAGAFRASTGYWVSPQGRVRVEYAVESFGRPRVRLWIDSWGCDLVPAPLIEILRRVPEIANRGFNANAAQTLPAREARRLDRAKRQ